MKYWHIQMHMPEGKGGKKIASVDMLKEAEPIIGTGEWDSSQCVDFKGDEDGGVKIGDIVLVREGKVPIALCEVTGETFQDIDLSSKYININFRRVRILDFSNDREATTLSQGTLKSSIDKDSAAWQYINNWYLESLKNIETLNMIAPLKSKKQIVLQGAPGTGKTYLSAELAMKIIAPKQTFETRKGLMDAYKKAVEDKQIAFVTFHQSMDYEEFVEGLKPVVDKGSISYEPTGGIFKDICEEASYTDKSSSLDEALEKFKDELFKIESAGKPLKQLNTKAGGVFTVEYSGGKTFKIYPLNSQADSSTRYPASIANIRKLHKGDIGGKGWYNPSYVWGIYEHLKKQYKVTEYVESSDKNYVLIIDEMNRGNISKIFGELITAIEADKRIGEDNYIPITLPYSKEEFGVPSNLYIIGTMNTADRSIGHIDYAIRRRFAFVTLTSDRNVIESYYSSDDTLRGKALICFDKVYKLINESIVPDFDVDDLMIGHSYFLAKDDSDFDLKLKYEIIPIIEEYVKDGVVVISDDNKEWRGQLL